MAARATRKEGRKEAEARKEARHTCGGEEPRCLEEVDPVFRLITSLLSSRPLSSFRPNTKARDYKSSDRLSSGASASMRSSSNLLSWTRNSSGQTDSFQTNFDY